MAADIRFALNHMAAPGLRLGEFFALAQKLGIREAEIRNDLAGNAILDGTPPATVRMAAEATGITIISINALQRFNEWTPEREAEAIQLADYARGCGARALVLVPKNDGTGRANGERQGNLRVALKALAPLLQSRGLIGLVEPLGFEICSLRLKSEAAEAIKATGGQGVFKLVHDTFHHHLAGEAEMFPEMTGLIHISGVSDRSVSVPDMRDSHRVLIDATDRLDNIGQIRAMVAAGYRGPLSFEPFAAEVHALTSAEPALRTSMELIRSGVAKAAA